MTPTAVTQPADQTPVDLKAKLRAEATENGKKDEIHQEDVDGDDDDGDEEVAAEGAAGGAYLFGSHMHWDHDRHMCVQAKAKRRRKRKSPRRRRRSNLNLLGSLYLSSSPVESIPRETSNPTKMSACLACCYKLHSSY